MLTLQSY